MGKRGFSSYNILYVTCTVINVIIKTVSDVRTFLGKSHCTKKGPVLYKNRKFTFMLKG